MKFYTGKDYPHLCVGCQATVDQCVELVEIGPDTDDNEAPLMLAGDHMMLCGKRECSCTCSIGYPKIPYDDEDKILCESHGGTEAEKQEARERLCDRNGHWFPHWTAREKRDWVCLSCASVLGRVEIVGVEYIQVPVTNTQGAAQ